MLEGLQLLWGEQELCDVTVSSQDGTQVPCHSLILAAGSLYFRGLFTGGGKSMRNSLDFDPGLGSPSSNCKDLNLPIESGSALWACLRAIYGIEPQVC